MSRFADLRRLLDAPGPFLTITFPTPSTLDDAAHRLDVRWRNARREAQALRWADDDLAELDEIIATLPHDGGAGLVILRASDGTTLLEFVDEPLAEHVVVSNSPHLATVLAARQRAIPHIVVEADRAGADIHAFDGGQILSTEQVEGDTEHIHRGHPGGWSQRRFQQRAENTWERNADDVAEVIVDLDGRIDAALVFVAGDVRARHLVRDALPDRVRDRTVLIEAGSPEGIAEEVVRQLADHAARHVRELAEQVRNRVGTASASTDLDDVMSSFEAGRVEHLLVHDDGSDDVVTSAHTGGFPAGTRMVDAAIGAALRSDADITVVPNLALLDGPVAALYRW
jgi:hypothetical protein